MRTLVARLLVFSLLAVACSSAGTGLVATVADVEITEADVGELYDTDSLPVDEQLRQTIFAVIAREVFVQSLDSEFAATIDTEAVDALYAQLVADMETAGATPEEVLDIPDAGLGMVRFNAEIGVIRDTVIDLLLVQQDTVDAFFSDPTGYTTVCVRHVLVATSEEAADAQARLEAGEDFAAVASELSLDTGTPGGDLGCSVAGRYVTEFAAASLDSELGELVGPVETQFGFHLLIVDDRFAPTQEDFLADPVAFVSEQEMGGLWGDWFNDQLQNADVSVESRYGTWSPIGIAPPEEE